MWSAAVGFSSWPSTATNIHAADGLWSPQSTKAKYCLLHYLMLTLSIQWLEGVVDLVGWATQAVESGLLLCEKARRTVVCIQCCWCLPLSWASSILWEVAEATAEEGLPGSERSPPVLWVLITLGSWLCVQDMLCRTWRGTGALYLCCRHWWELGDWDLVPGFRAVLISWLQCSTQHMNDYWLLLVSFSIKSCFMPAGIYTS